MAAKKNNKQTEAVTKENVVAAEPVKQKKRNLKKGESVASATPASKPVVEMEKIIAREEAASQSVSDRLDRIASVSVSPFAKYDEVYNKSEEEDDDDDDDDVKIAPRKPAVTLPVEKKPATTRSRSPKNMACEPSSMPQHIISDDKAAISKLTKGNVWDTDVEEIYNMLLEGKHTEHWAEKRVKYMNIIRPVYDVEFIDMDDNKTIASLEESNFKIFAYPDNDKDKSHGIAIRKHQIKKVTDLTMENIWHLSPLEVIELMRNNMGTGWKGLPLPIQDIIESAFYVDSSTLPETIMHRAGGIIERRKSDGYEALEIARGTWIEAIFLKEKPKYEKEHFSSSLSTSSSKLDDDSDEDEEEEDADDEEEDVDDNDSMDEEMDEDEDISMDEENPQIEDLESIPDDVDDEEDE
jgi:hypothetical protein